MIWAGMVKPHYTNDLSSAMYERGTKIDKDELAEKFASFFDAKIKVLQETVAIKDDVYNGTQKITEENKMFMDIFSIREVLQTLKIKNTEGFDRIPQRVLVDGADHLVVALEA